MKQSPILVVSLLIVACARAAPPATRAPAQFSVSTSTALPSTPFPNSNAQSPTSASQSTICSPQFAFGVAYAVPGLAQINAQLGARSTRPAAETSGRDQVEPCAPGAAGQHQYDWAKVDRYVLEYQNVGFDQIQIYTTAFSNWASSKPKQHFPDMQYLNDYEDYIFHLVERNDADGKADAPGLKYPVLDDVIEHE